MPPLRPLAVGLLTASALASQEACRQEATATVSIERETLQMGTRLRVGVESSRRESALAASERAVEAVRGVEQRLSTWRADTELAALNRAPLGTPVELGTALAHDLEQALRWSRVTEGAFDPRLGALVGAWGLRSGGRRPSLAELSAARASSGAQAMRVDGRTATRLSRGARVEEGGFAKGIALDAALAALAQDRAILSAFVDLGGQVAVLGRAQTWALADPTDRQHPVCSLRLDRGSLATSGNSERAIAVGGERLGHVLDPRTGRPAVDFGSLAVWSPSATAADCLSTGLYVLGPERALAFAAERDDCEVVVLQARGQGLRVRASAGLRGRLRSLLPDLPIEFSAARGAASTTR